MLYTQEVFYTHFNLVAHGCQDKDKMAAIPAASATWLSTNSFHPPQAQDTGKQWWTNPQKLDPPCCTALLLQMLDSIPCGCYQLLLAAPPCSTQLCSSTQLPLAQLCCVQFGFFQLTLDLGGLRLTSATWFHMALPTLVLLFSTSRSHGSEEWADDTETWHRIWSTRLNPTSFPALERGRQNDPLPGCVHLFFPLGLCCQQRCGWYRAASSNLGHSMALNASASLQPGHTWTALRYQTPLHGAARNGTGETCALLDWQCKAKRNTLAPLKCQ